MKLFVLFCFVMFAQNSVDLKNEAIRENGVVINTVEGMKTAHISPGYIYINGLWKAQLLNGLCGIDHRMSELPKYEGTGHYRFIVRASGFHVAVYKNGLRLTPEKHYKLWWDNPEYLPIGVEILNDNNESDVVVDYQVGFQQ